MSSPSTFINTEDLQADVIRFCDDPDAFFGSNDSNLHSIPNAELETLHLEALKYRFNTLADKIPVLKKLVKDQGIEQINTLEDAVPLFFEHTMYKSYPPVLLEQNRFADINKFISRLTTFDLSSVDVSQCQSIDEWFEIMDRETELCLLHSSGTSGTMSFVPISKRELEKTGRATRTKTNEALDDGDDSELYCIYPYFRSGGSGFLRMNDMTVKYVVGDESHFFAAYSERLSSDVLYLGAKIRDAKSKGTLDRLQVNPSLMDRVKEFEELQQNMPEHLDKFFDKVIDELRGKRIITGGTWNILYNFAKKGLERGEEGVFAANSIISTGGGAKGMTPPENWKEDVCRFIGADKIREGYGMSEAQGQHWQCDHGHYHFSPQSIPFLLEPGTNKPLPRKGIVTGRAAFFDVGAETRWGGFISGDEITVNWETPCPCGKQSYYIEGNIERYSDKEGGDDKISCAATEEAHKEAMDFLTDF